MAEQSQMLMMIFDEACEDRNTSPELILQIVSSIEENLDNTIRYIVSNADILDKHKQALDGLRHWKTAYTAIADKNNHNRVAIKTIVKNYICTDSPYSMSPYDVVQTLMKCTIRLIWATLYKVSTAAGHIDPERAIRDALQPQEAREMFYIQEMMKEIAADGGESIEEMTERIASQ